MRIRTTKPEYWRSKDTARLTYFARLLYIGLWNYVDDNGVGEWDLDLMRSDLFPRDPVKEVSANIRGGLAELSHAGQIVRYTDTRNGREYFAVVNWHHQRIDKPSKSDKPKLTSEYAVVHEDSLNALGTLWEDSRLYLGTKGSRDQGGAHATNAPPACPKHPNGSTTRCGACAEVRKWNERNAKAVEEQAALTALVERTARLQCPDCDDNGWVLADDDTTHRCDHTQAVVP
jgi:hypothetical protein